MRILILEDNADRQAEMSAVLCEQFPQYPFEFFCAAPPMLSRVSDGGLDDVVAILLNHDLEMLPGEDGGLVDPGTGLDVVELLETLQPQPPVVIHTTNRVADDSMKSRLRRSGWSVSRVVPYGDLDWIREVWLGLLRQAIASRVPTPRADAEH